MPRTDSQRALDTIIYSLDHAPELLEEAQSIAFLRGQPHERLMDVKAKMECTQTYKPRHTRLVAAGFQVVEELAGDRDLVLLTPERQKEQTLADMAHGLDLLKEGGTLLVALHNDWGARRFQDHLFDLAGEGQVVTKHHCRGFWVTKDSKRINQALLAEWRTMADLRRMTDGGFWTRPGLFAWDHIDAGSALLMPFLRERLTGMVADLGCGWGYLSSEVLASCPGLKGLDGFDADRDAVEAARRNVGNVPVPFRPRIHWQDVTEGVGERHYDAVVMNPPFHEGREPDPTIGTKFIAAAAKAMKQSGELWLVANIYLPYEQTLREMFDNVETPIQQGGYKVMHATLPRHDLFFHRGMRERRGKWR